MAIEILGELGRGGMGVVYKARQRRPEPLRGAENGPGGRTRQCPGDWLGFSIEAEAVARLQHPNIVQIYEVGEQEGLPFFSLEFVDGGSLSTRRSLACRSRPREAAQMIEALARAMHFAHEHGIVHRDLKPANILLSHGCPWGTAFPRSPISAWPSSSSRWSGPDRHRRASWARPATWPPSRPRRRSEQVGPATDVYALGAILYELLTGRPPFKAEPPWTRCFRWLFRTGTARRLRPRMPRDLETICLKCLEKTRRPLRHGSASCRRPGMLRRPPADSGTTNRIARAGSAWAKRRPAAAALVVVSGLGVATALAGSIVYNVKLEEARAKAVTARNDADDNAEVARTEADRAAKRPLQAKRNFEKAREAVTSMLDEV